ncbi:DUF2922 domain-containing protein [Fervidobacterium nodosum]|uniref:DUF2922 domain-containing protein n=1 Tax=Fervidobacterium nodosum (strain ATCC 35602 / DSM 5306 / Rt17-B1) TaxID=381764 RepID=A7HJ10_FERNB|nr:DUF2922 family protein [Fervidobacterium nodosum]ABS59893.1 hypothetical protein Fnod_0020 [Fervidobacterium nodosum Rt17-B1]PHJ12313.1 hypothetical protein IM41_07880 [Fervidobacterium sp. SC_NGM5_G05]
MKRLTLVYRKLENGQMKTYRINIPEPVDNINVQELQQDMEYLKAINVVPDGFEPDEARVTETNIEVLINLIE